MSGGMDINFDIKVMHGYRRFCNKIYQATKYVLGKLDSSFLPQKHPTKTGRESLSEFWILHKLNTAAAEINTALEAREFSQATGITYQYWYTSLCDVYIENSKAIIQDGTPEEQESAKQTLYTALECGLAMIHPFMPFLTEELWQRLPRRPEDTCPSIMKAAYPEYNPALDDRESEEAYELILAVAKGIRSVAAEYSIKDSAHIYIQLFTPSALQTCESQLASIKQLGGKAMMGEGASISILSAEDAKPGGCVVQAVSASAAVYLLVKGRIDINAEVEKAKAKLAKAEEGKEKKTKVINGDGWDRMAEEVKETRRRELDDAEREVGLLEGALAQFERLRLE